jgi:protein O-mannosyl-transferase
MESPNFRLETTWDISRKPLVLGLYLFLAACIAAVYAQVGGFGFVDYDDPLYVSGNSHVLGGLTWDGVKWAFTTMHAGNWIPLVWLSLMLDSSIFGTWAGGFHLVNVALHIANSILLFLVLRRYTKSLWASIFVAALFAFHPLHVESVAWVTERKDTLSTLFWFLTMLAYLRYVEIPTAGRYVIACGIFAMGLMSKSMLVTLPLVLLLMDYWPLERIGRQNVSLKKLIIEKIPLFILSVIVCVVTVIAQRGSGAVSKINSVPLGPRINNALVSYCEYILKMFWPVDLAVFYPHPVSAIARWKVILSLVVLLSITIAVILLRRRRYLLVGWFWYLGTLVPVIGFVQVGAQSLADRYTYIPLTGIFIMLAWFAGDMMAQRRPGQIFAGAAGAAILALLAIVTFMQVGYWRDTLTLFERCAAVTADNVTAHKYLGIGFAKKDNYESALREFKESLRFEPEDPRTYYNMALIQVKLGRTDEAIDSFRRVVEIEPNNIDSNFNLAALLANKGLLDEAIEQMRKTVKLSPTDAAARCDLAQILLQKGKADEAIVEYQEALKINPADQNAVRGLEQALALQK